MFGVGVVHIVWDIELELNRLCLRLLLRTSFQLSSAICCKSLGRQQVWFSLSLFRWFQILHTWIANRSIGFPFSKIQLHNSLKSAKWILERKFHLSPSHTSFKLVQLHNACKVSSACKEQRSQLGFCKIVLRTRFCFVGREFLHARHSRFLYLFELPGTRCSSKISCPPPSEC